MLGKGEGFNPAVDCDGDDCMLFKLRRGTVFDTAPSGGEAPIGCCGTRIGYCCCCCRCRSCDSMETATRSEPSEPVAIGELEADEDSDETPPPIALGMVPRGKDC
jgi:hypothetical protein